VPPPPIDRPVTYSRWGSTLYCPSAMSIMDITRPLVVAFPQPLLVCGA
jgi:hypothetical protein